jgi:hydrogenase 3 maturation protease
MGVGNPDRGDDGIGSFIASELIRKGFDLVIDCRELPENFITKVCNMSPDTVVIVDAVNMGDIPGTIRILNPESVFQGITAHNCGLDIISRFIKNSCNAQIYIMAIQPENIIGAMTESVKESGKKIIEYLSEKLTYA